MEQAEKSENEIVENKNGTLAESKVGIDPPGNPKGKPSTYEAFV